MGRWWLQSVLVGVVFVLGLLQGSRAALGRMPPLPELESPAGPVADAREVDSLRGHFFRPEGSTAVRPVLRLRESRWLPDEPMRSALACPGPGC